jgi:uncharacterized damage-inducible protein DinB
MIGRPHRDRLLDELKGIRTELAQEVERLKPEEFDWAPRPDMKTFAALLREIGAMEKLCVHWLTHQTVLDWKEAADALVWKNGEPDSAVEALERVREETRSYLNRCSEEQLETPVSLPEAWHVYWGPTVEPEEMIRWVGRHEYYHLGQIISYRWILGDNPYKRS